MTLDVGQPIQPIVMTTRGPVDERDKELARQRISHLFANLTVPVQYAEVKLISEADPARQRPCLAEAVLAVNGRTVRAHVAADVMGTAIDLLHDRLRRRLDRLHSMQVAHRRGGIATERPTRHGEEAAQRPERRVRPVDERELVRHKTFAVDEMTPDEAIDVLDLLGHDFLLFTNLNTGADAVVWYSPDNGIELLDAADHADPDDHAAAVGPATVAPVRLSNVAVPTFTVAEATEELDLDLQPFVFFVEPSSGRGHVVYHRYDGNYGLISPA